MTNTRLDLHSVPGSPLCSWKTCHLPLASPLPLPLVFKGPCLRPVWVSSDPATVRDKCDVRVCWIQGIYVKHMHSDKDVPPGTFGSVFFVQEQRCCCVPKWCDHQKDVKSPNYFFTALQPRPQHSGFYFTLLRDEDQQDLQGSVLLSDQVDSKQVPLPDCFSSQRMKDCRPFFNCNSHTSPFKDCSDPFCDCSDI